MNRLSCVTCLLTLVLPASAGDVQGHAVITKRLTKKALSPNVYNLRGAVPGVASPAQPAPVSEFDRFVVVLEGGAPSAKPAETVVIDQRNMRFDPDLVVIPTGSTVQFPNGGPIFQNIFSLSKTQPFDLGAGADVQWSRGHWSVSGEWQRFWYDLPNFVQTPSVTAG